MPSIFSDAVPLSGNTNNVFSDAETLPKQNNIFVNVKTLPQKEQSIDEKTGMPSNESLFQQYMTPSGITFDPNAGMHPSPKDRFIHGAKEPYKEPLVHETERNFYNAYVPPIEKSAKAIGAFGENLAKQTIKDIKHAPLGVYHNIATVLDMLRDIPQIAVGLVAYPAVKAYKLMTGSSSNEASDKASEIEHKIQDWHSSPFEKIYQHITGDSTPDDLQELGNVIHIASKWGAKKVSDVTGLNEKDSNYLLNVVQFLGPVKAASLLARGTTLGAIGASSALRATGDVVGEAVKKGFTVEKPHIEPTLDEVVEQNVKARQKNEPISQAGKQQLELLNEQTPVNVKPSTLSERAREDLSLNPQKGFTPGKEIPRTQQQLFPGTLPGIAEKTKKTVPIEKQADLFPKELEEARQTAKEVSEPKSIQESIEPKSLYGTFKSSFAKYYSETPVARSVQDFNTYDTFIAREKLRINQQLNHLNELVPDHNQQIELGQWLEGKDVQLGKNGLESVRTLRNILNRYGEMGIRYGVLNDLRDMYLPHLWEETQNLAGRVMGGNRKAHRIFPDIETGKKEGFTPVTENPLALVHHYAMGMTVAIARKQLLESLIDKGMIVKAKHNGNFVPVNLRGLDGYVVDPSIAEELHFAYSSKNVYTALNKLEALSYALKRNALGYSLFHPFTLYTTMLFMHPDKMAVTGRFARMAAKSAMPEAWMKKLPQSVQDYFTIPELKLLRSQDVDPVMLQRLAEGHVQLTLGNEHPIVEESGNLYNFTREITRFINDHAPMGIPVFNGFIKLNEKLDHFTWQGVHTGFKTMLFMHQYQELLENNIRAHDLNPSKYPLRKPSEIAHDAGLSVNVLLGGLNWRDVATSTKNQLLRTGLMKLMKPTSRRIWQQIMLAPDWTTSTLAAWTLAFGKGSGLRGILKPQYLADLQRQYILKAALYYGILANGLNMHWNNGKPIWENADPTTVVLPNGKKLQIAKHIFEPMKWMEHPSQEFINKLNVLTSEGLDQLLDVEYIKIGGYSPKMKNRWKHLLNRFKPIAASNLTDENSSFSGLIGFPTSGLDYKQQEEKKQAAKQKERETRQRKKYKKYEYTGD